MKLHYTKILLFFFPLYILVTSYHVYSKNKPSITSHHTQTNRSLCECDTQSTNYNNDEDIKSVKENFDRQTSQRFDEYNKRMQEKRRICKEQCEKDIQQIILKDKAEKSLEKKIEKGCLRCGCGLGGVAASVGIIGPIAVMTKQGAAGVIQGNQFSTQETIKVAVKPIVSQAETVAERAVKTATEEVIKNSTAAAESTYAGCQTAIIASVVAIIIIALVMIIIYLVLRYRRKKKMKKKAEYTKLLNQ
ncbi:rifin [Plasmodium falciparum RAJ116]|uniref:Rifin n=1 Tax=Plasmodium falciparum RAJ116 TaxID=580058 RepID=A0A0L0CS63_PLAFA|nr:rifin [Plasmodium falciparum RAJ116]